VKTFDENKLRFRFGERWHVDKWDKCDTYTGGVGKLCGELTDTNGALRTEGTKAVDFVGVLDEQKLYLFEVKDFRGHQIENRKRQVRELPLEIGLKVRDTLAGLTGAYARTGGTGWIELCGQVLAGRKHQVYVVAWLADDRVRPAEPRGKRAAYDSVRRAQIQQKLAWLTPRVCVEDPLEPGVPDVSVENLPGAGRR
jgi:hypothetical protein